MRVRGRLSSERGSVVVMFAVSLLAMLALAALAVDLGLLRDSRAQAQRAADAIALAGATAFRDFPTSDSATADSAGGRALEIARLNLVRADTLYVDDSVSTWLSRVQYPWGTHDSTVKVVETRDVTLNIIPDSQIVRAWVRRAGIRTTFGKLLSVPFGHVQAMATAWASGKASTVNCLKPFLIPDMWSESDHATQDVNGNNYMDTQSPGEQWLYEPNSSSDYYLPYDPSVPNDPSHPQTGYGSGLRSGYPSDLGIPLVLKPQTGTGQRQGNFYYTLDGPKNNLTENIKSGCISATIGSQPVYATGPLAGLVNPGITELYNEDKDASWDPVTQQVRGSSYNDWTKSPRVITVAFMDPRFIEANDFATGDPLNAKPNSDAVYNNFARLFLLAPTPGGSDDINALFIGYAPGSSGGTPGGSLVKQLQLIQ